MPSSERPAVHARSSRTRPSWWTAGVGLSLAATVSVLAGCGNLTAGGFGEARVVVSGDAPDTVPLTSMSAPLLTLAPARADDDDDDVDDPEGEIEVDFRLYLERQDGGSYPLSDDDLEVELDLDGDIEADAVRARIPTGSYRSLRIVFVEVDIQVDAGVVIDGTPIQGPIDIELDSSGLDVLRAIDVTVREGDVVELLLDLNAATWLRAIDPATNTVSPTAFADAFGVVVRR